MYTVINEYKRVNLKLYQENWDGEIHGDDRGELKAAHYIPRPTGCIALGQTKQFVTHSQ